jgi:hypothetical protein
MSPFLRGPRRMTASSALRSKKPMDRAVASLTGVSTWLRGPYRVSSAGCVLTG